MVAVRYGTGRRSHESIGRYKGHYDSTTQRLDRHRTLAEGFLAASNTQDVERVLACYTEDVLYRDPNTRGELCGHEALGHYLRKLFGRWEMYWSTRELFPLDGVEGSAVLWRATIKAKGGERNITVEGMDLAVLRGDVMERDEVYLDRALLAPLLGTGETTMGARP